MSEVKAGEFDLIAIETALESTKAGDIALVNRETEEVLWENEAHVPYGLFRLDSFPTDYHKENE